MLIFLTLKFMYEKNEDILAQDFTFFVSELEKYLIERLPSDRIEYNL